LIKNIFKISFLCGTRRSLRLNFLNKKILLEIVDFIQGESNEATNFSSGAVSPIQRGIIFHPLAIAVNAVVSNCL